MYHGYETSLRFQFLIYNPQVLIRMIPGAVSSVDVVMTPCGGYTYFCCGQDDAARSCCTSGNGTVLLAAGTAIFPTATVTYNNTITATTSPTGCPLGNSTAASNINQSTKNTVPVGTAAGLGAALGLALIIVAVLIVMWSKNAHRAKEAEQRIKEKDLRIKELGPLERTARLTGR